MTMMRQLLLGLVFLLTTTPAVYAQGGPPRKFNSAYYVANIDKLTGEDRSFVYIAANEPERNRKNASLMFTCRNGVPFVSYLFDTFYAASLQSEAVRVMYRFDKGELVRSRWYMGGSHIAAVIGGNPARTFIKQAKMATEVVIRAIDIDGEESTDTFNLMGLTRALQELPCSL